MRQQHLGTTPFSRRCLIGLAALFTSLLPTIPAQATQTVNMPTRTTLTASRLDGSSTAGATLAAVVQTATGTPAGTGTVDFLLPNGQSLGSAIVAADGTATLIVTQLPATQLPATQLPAASQGVAGDALGITAVYHAAGANGFEDSKSVTTSLAVPSATAPVAPDFTVTGNPTTVTTAQGAYGSTALTISSVGGFTGAMQFSCSTLPTGVTCAFNPAQQVLGANGSFASTLQIQTQSSEGIQAASTPAHTGLALALAVPGALALLGLAGSRRKRGMQLLAALLLVSGAGLGLSGCSQRYAYLKHPPPVAGGTAVGTYPIVVAVDGSQGSSVVEHDITISLVVQ